MFITVLSYLCAQLASAEEIAELKTDVAEECAQFGKVVNVFVPAKGVRDPFDGMSAPLLVSLSLFSPAGGTIWDGVCPV